MRNLKKLAALFLAAALILSLSAAAFAAVEDTGFSDVDAGAWYAGAVMYCSGHDLVTGTGNGRFDPGSTMTRAQFAMVLYRLKGTPVVTGTDAFTDTDDGAWYSDAVLWVSQQGLIGGYGGGLFGPNDPVSREQIATILWRYEGCPKAEQGADFADGDAISSYAADAVDWAKANRIINGRTGNLFAPKAGATRAEVATILMNYTRREQPAPAPVTTTEPTPAPEVTPTPEPTPEPAPGNEAKVLIAYFSATNNTENIAGHIRTTLGSDADLYEIVPEVPYTSADLNYNTDCRANREQNDPSARPTISGSVDNMEQYDVIFLGYPIWWGQAPKIMYTFLEGYDFSGKTIVPFCTSGSSGIGSSATNLHPLAPAATWLDGQRFSGSASQSAVESWVNGLGLTLTPAP